MVPAALAAKVVRSAVVKGVTERMVRTALHDATPKGRSQCHRAGWHARSHRFASDEVVRSSEIGGRVCASVGGARSPSFTKARSPAVAESIELPEGSLEGQVKLPSIEYRASALPSARLMHRQLALEPGSNPGAYRAQIPFRSMIRVDFSGSAP